MDKLDLIDKELCERSYFYFLKLFWNEIITEKMQNSFHIEYLSNEMQNIGERIVARQPKEYDLIINIPPGQSKSTIATIYFPVWLWIKDPSIRVISGSYAATLSIEHATKSRTLIRSDKFQKFWGDKIVIAKDNDNKSYYSNNKGGERKSVSVGGAVTGSHAHLLLIDDPVNPKQANSDVLLSTSNKWIDETLSTRVVDAAITPTILIMQRLHENDATGVKLKKLEKDPNLKIKHICLPASDDYPIYPPELRSKYIDGVLDPLRKPKAILNDFKSKLGSYGYAAQMGQQPAPPEGNIIKSKWFQYYDKKMIVEQILNNKLHVDFFIDSAYSEKSEKNNDPSALIAFTVYQKNLYILNCIDIWLDFPDLIKFIPKFTSENFGNKKSLILVEPKASGKSIVQFLKRETTLNIKEGINPTNSKIERTRTNSPFLESERVYLPKDDIWVQDFLKQIETFPYASHDDKVDCLNAAIDRARKWQNNNVSRTHTM
jgi:predicted phage terminase large subunit-like protein